MFRFFIPFLDSYVGLKNSWEQNLFYISRATSTCDNTDQKTRFAMADVIKVNVSVLKGKDCGLWPVQRCII